MRQLLFSLLFGADEISQHMYDLLTIRKAAVNQHEANKKLQSLLKTSTERLGVLKGDYAATKTALESAYQLVLD